MAEMAGSYQACVLVRLPTGDGMVLAFFTISKRVADDLAQYSEWQPYLHELDEVEVKHCIPVAVVNLYADQFGNPEVPNKIKYTAAERAAAQKRAARSKRRQILVLIDSGSVIHRDHSLDAASQHHLGSDPQRSSFSGTGCGKEIVNRTHLIKDDLRRASLTNLRPKRKPLLFPASCVRALSAGFMTLARRVHRAMPGVDARPVLNQRE
jgi:hypothetical protein